MSTQTQTQTKKTIRFYSENEKAELSKISKIKNSSLRSKKIKIFAEKNKRGFHTCYCKMLTLIDKPTISNTFVKEKIQSETKVNTLNIVTVSKEIEIEIDGIRIKAPNNKLKLNSFSLEW